MSETKHSTPVLSPSPYLHRQQTTIPRPPQSSYRSSLALWHLRIMARQMAYSLERLWTLLRAPFLGMPSLAALSLFRHPQDFVFPDRNPCSNEIVSAPQEQRHSHLLKGWPFGWRFVLVRQGLADLITVSRSKISPGATFFILGIIALINVSCATDLTPTTSKAICSGWKPITYSSKLDRPVTVAQIKSHNLFGIRRHCWTVGGK